MPDVPAYLLGALQFREPRCERLRDVTDSEWESLLSSWRTARLMLPLRQSYGDNLPDWVRTRLDVCMADNALRFERIKAIYAAAAKVLKEADAGHIVLKGFSLWPGYSDHPRFRPQSDIDLFCPPESIFRARDALAAIGYQPNLKAEHLPKDHLAVMAPQTTWEWRGYPFDPDVPVGFELHYCLWNQSLMHFRPTGLEQFWLRRIERRLDDISFPSLAPADNLAYTALNILRDRLRAVPAAEQVYGLARFLHLHANNHAFWAMWRDLHHESLRCLEIISFRLAAESFSCTLSEEVHEEIDRLPTVVQAWFRQFSKFPLSARFDRMKDGIWLHVNLLDSFRDKSWVLFSGLLSIPVAMPTFTSALGEDEQGSQGTPQGGPSRAPSVCRKAIKYAGWAAHRVTARFAKLPFFLWRGLRYWLSTKGLSKQFWTFFAAAFLFDFGMYIFFLLYNLYLLDRGFRENFLGLVASASAVGGIAGTIPAGMLAQRFGLRKALLLCSTLVPLTFALRSLLVSESLLLALAFLGGAAFTIWAVCISPAIAQLTNDQSRPFGFSVVFSSGIAVGILGGQAGGRLPGWLAHMDLFATDVRAKQMALLTACGIVALAAWPIFLLRFASVPARERTFYPRNPFLVRFLPAIAVWSLAIGAFNPFFNVYFSQYLHIPVKQIGFVYSFSHLSQVLAILASPVIFKKFGLVTGIMYTQIAAAIGLGCLAAVPGASAAAVVYAGYTAFQWMSEPGMFSLLMNQVAQSERTGASALNFLVLNVSQAIAAAAAGASFARFGYPTVLGVTSGVALAAAFLFRLLLGKFSPPVSQRLPSSVGL